MDTAWESFGATDALKSAAKDTLGILDEKLTIRYKELQILERIDEVTLGNRGIIIGKDMDCPPVVWPTMVV